MHFTRLRLMGFKSFVEPQDFVIDRGLTGIVGPNGCGKSNLVEAIRWVMGENSYKNMRASGMDDVIFSGTKTRPPRSSAEVIVFLDNRDHRAPPSFNAADELQVSRRIERERGSIYRINGRDVRTKDVQLLFADQSTGARSPSMVGQGRVGELIQAKPQARRALLEEAAGISGLHSRRREAELRLQAAEQNLERIGDVVSGLSARIDHVRRQVRSASRYRNLTQQIQEKEALLLFLQWQTAKSEQAEAHVLLNSATIKVAQCAQQHLARDRDYNTSLKTLSAVREQAAAARATVQRLQLAMQELELNSKRRAQREDELTAYIRQLDQDVVREDSLLQENARAIAVLDAEEQALHDDLSGSDKVMEEKGNQLKALADALSTSERAFSEATELRAKILASHDQLQKQITELAAKEQDLGQRARIISAEHSALKAERERITSYQSKLLERASLNDRLTEEQATLEKQQQHVRFLRKAVEETRMPYEAARDQFQTLTSEYNTIARLASALTKDRLHPIVDHVSVTSGYEKALSAALADDLLASVDECAPAHWRKLQPLSVKADLPEGVPSLATYVEAPEQLARCLNFVGVVDEKEGFDLQQSLAVGHSLVSVSGYLWRWDGLCQRPDAPSLAAQRLEHDSHLARIKPLLATAEQVMGSLEENLKQLSAELALALSREDQCRESVKSIAGEREVWLRELTEVEARATRADARLAALDESSAQLTDEQSKLRASRKQIERDIEALPSGHAVDERLASLNKQCVEGRRQVSNLRVWLASQQDKKTRDQRRLQNIANERNDWRARVAAGQRQLTTLKLRHLAAKNELNGMRREPDQADAQRDALIDELRLSEQRARTLSDQLSQAESEQALAARHVNDAFADLASAREERARIDERVNALSERVSDIETRIASIFACPPLRLKEVAGVRSETSSDANTLNEELEHLKREREKLGAVNLRAEEEEKDLRLQQQAIIGERDDITKAIKELRDAITSLNREGRDRLLKAFHDVNEQFQQLFARLFGGGQAYLELQESDDPLQSGLEIVAWPPGKKPQTLTLLSGGEQALTALALIFAVFLTNPAPICVLDEVDAPLDDHNVERYCNLLDEMARLTATRFMVITHNPITMARMNRLFGVTMAEQGVSQLVSVTLDQADRMREQASLL